MRCRRPIQIDHGNSRTRPQRGAKVVQQPIRLLDLMIHVDEQNQINRGDRQAWIVRIAQSQCNIAEPFALYPAPQPFQVARYDILRDHLTSWPDTGCEPHGIVPTSRPHVRHPHPRSDVQQAHHIFRFARAVAGCFVRPGVGDNPRDWPVRGGKRVCRQARWRERANCLSTLGCAVPPTLGAGSQEEKGKKGAPWRTFPATSHCTAFIRSNIGRYIAITIPPIRTPITTIMIGSRIEVSAVTAASTSSS